MSAKTRYYLIMLISLGVLISLMIGSMFLGAFELTATDVGRILFARPALISAVKRQVLLDIRLPRIIMSAAIGAVLSMSGATMQGVLRNPLAGPDVLGTSVASGFGAAVGILLFAKRPALIYLLSFGMGIVSILAVYGLCYLKRSYAILSIILSGMIVSSIFVSLISVTKFVADTEETLPAITFWLMGSLSSVRWHHLEMVVLPFAVGTVSLLLLRWKLNILSLGDDEAMILGAKPKLLKRGLMAVTTVMIAATVTVAGVIGWVGLVIPHLTRRIIGYNHGYLLPLTGIWGAIFMVVIDDLARNLSASEIPIGILTALVGAPVFAVIFLFKKEES